MILKKLTIKALLMILCSFSITTYGQKADELTLEKAEKLLELALQRANELKVKVNIAIVDKGADLKAFKRMDGAYLGSIDVAIKKAKTARYFDVSTRDLGKLTQPGGIIYNIEHSNGGLITFPGGIPLKDKNGDIIGAIGISGATIDEDEDIAYFAAKFLLQ